MNNQTNKLIPELRFPEFTNEREWQNLSLENVIDNFIVPMRDKPKQLDGEIPWCRIEDFNGMYLYGSKSNQGVSLETIKEMNLKVYPVNTLLVSCSADIGRCAITQKLLITNQTFIGLVPNIKKVNTIYLYYVMTNSKNELNARSSGTTISYLSRQQFEKFEIRVPSLTEQQKIASCLFSLDELLTAHTDKLENLKIHKKGLIQNLFPQEGEKAPKFRFKEFENDGEWVEIFFSDLLDDIIDFRGRTPLKLGMNWGNGDIVSLSANNVKNGYIDYKAECNLGSENLYKKWMGNVNLEKGDVVFTMEAPLGNALLIPDSQKYILSQRVVAFKTKKEFHNSFIIQLIWSNKFQNEIKKLSTGSTAMGIGQKTLKNILIRVPKNTIEQEQIGETLSSLDNIIKEQADKIEQLKLHKKGLLQGLFPRVKN